SRFDLAAAYIDGYFHALMNFRPESGVVYELRKFAYWLALKFKQPRNWHWSGILKAVYSDVEILSEELPSLFKEFLSDKDKIDSTRICSDRASGFDSKAKPAADYHLGQ